jgi:hypothetical protein
VSKSSFRVHNLCLCQLASSRRVAAAANKLLSVLVLTNVSVCSAGEVLGLLDVTPALLGATDSSTVPLRSDDYDSSFDDLLQQPLDNSSSSAPIIIEALLDETQYSASSAKRARTDDTTCST